MDRLWYHRLLEGAVLHGIEVEKALEAAIPQIGLTSAIGAASPFYIKSKKFGSDQKMDWFYGLISGLLILSAIASALNVQRALPASAETKGTGGNDKHKQS
jgi:hypothetical protein